MIFYFNAFKKNNTDFISIQGNRFCRVRWLQNCENNFEFVGHDDRKIWGRFWRTKSYSNIQTDHRDDWLIEYFELIIFLNWKLLFSCLKSLFLFKFWINFAYWLFSSCLLIYRRIINFIKKKIRYFIIV